MTQVVEDKKQPIASKKIINVSLITTIANSRAEHCIYTYSAKSETHFDIKAPGFFNPMYSFAQAGDTIRVFRFEHDTICTYYEFIVVSVDKIIKEVKVASVLEKNLQNSIIGK